MGSLLGIRFKLDFHECGGDRVVVTDGAEDELEMFCSIKHSYTHMWLVVQTISVQWCSIKTQSSPENLQEICLKRAARAKSLEIIV